MTFTTLINTDDLAAHRHESNWVVVDCRFSLADPQRGEHAYAHSHIPGAYYADLERDLSAPVSPTSGRHPLPEQSTFIAKLGEWGVQQDTQVVAYDDAGGAFAARLWWLLRWLGHEGVAVLDGGWSTWVQEGRAVTAEVPPLHQSVFRVKAPLTAVVSAAEVEAGLTSGAICLVDARAPERFHGEVEPIDPIAGHVPGAVNRPFQDNLMTDRFRSSAELRQDFEQCCAGFAAEQVVHMCGSGVTACHNVLAMEIAGMAGSRLYAGSWSEWIRDASRPVTRA